jgi:hypothetical protein
MSPAFYSILFCGSRRNESRRVLYIAAVVCCCCRLITPESITDYDPVPSVIRDPHVWLYRCIILSTNNYGRLSDLEACRFFSIMYDLWTLYFLENFLTV